MDNSSRQSRNVDARVDGTGFPQTNLALIKTFSNFRRTFGVCNCDNNYATSPS